MFSWTNEKKIHVKTLLLYAILYFQVLFSDKFDEDRGIHVVVLNQATVGYLHYFTLTMLDICM